MPQRGLIVGGVFVGLLIAAARPGFAQAGRAEIHGTVYDQDKAVLPGVTVTVIHEGQGTERSTITGAEGRLRPSHAAARHLHAPK